MNPNPLGLRRMSTNGTELGPTKPTDIPAGKKIDITLDATGEGFDTFSAHPEVG